MEHGKHVVGRSPSRRAARKASFARLAAERGLHLLAAPFVQLSPTLRAFWTIVGDGALGHVHSARALYGNAGSHWTTWYHSGGPGPLGEAGICNLKSLTALLGPVVEVLAAEAVAVQTREVRGVEIASPDPDVSHIILRHAEGALSSVVSSQAIQRYRRPALELYGTEGTANLLGDDWDPHGFEVWRNADASWEEHDAIEPTWLWADGLREVLSSIRDGRPPLASLEQDLHLLDVIAAARAIGGEPRAGVGRLVLCRAGSAAGAAAADRTPPRSHPALRRAIRRDVMSSTDWRRILVLASVVGFLEALLFSVLAPLLPDLEEGLGLSKASAGLLTSAYAAGAFIGALPSIWAARRFGVKATVLAGLILLAVSSAAFTVPESPWLVFAARIGQGAGSAFAYTGALAWLAAVAPPARRGELIGVTFAATFSGELVGPLLGAVAAWAGLALVFSIVAALAVLIAAVAAAIPAAACRAPRRAFAASTREQSSRRRRSVADRVDGAPAGCPRSPGAAQAGRARLGSGAIGAVFAIAALLQAASNPGVGRVADARGHTALLRAGLITSAGASALLVLDERALVYAAIMVAAAVAYATLWTPALALLSRTSSAKASTRRSASAS